MPTSPASPSTLEPLLRLVQGLPRARPQPSLRPFERLLEERTATPWWTSLDAVKITGSNGKGSVATLVAAILSACGVRTGLTTSPHVGVFNERIAVDGKPVSDTALLAADATLKRRLADVADSDEVTLSFEAVTFLAIEAMAKAGVETLVAEAGIGGRDDPTRLLPGGTHGLVSVDKEHLDLLGGDLEQVALNKADLAEPGGTLFLGDLPQHLETRVLETSQRRGVEVIPLRPGIKIGNVSMDGRESVFDLTVDGLHWRSLRCGLLGHHQAVNCALAIRLARHWLARNRPDLPRGELIGRVRQAVARVRLPGRLQRVREDPPVWIDTAHTPAAMEALALTLPQTLKRPWVWVAGVSSDKSTDDLMSPLLSLRCEGLARVVASRAEIRGGEAERVARTVAAQAPQIPCEVKHALPEALSKAMAWAQGRGGSVLVAGGLFLASETLEHLASEAEPPAFY